MNYSYKNGEHVYRFVNPEHESEVGELNKIVNRLESKSKTLKIRIIYQLTGNYAWYKIGEIYDVSASECGDYYIINGNQKYIPKMDCEVLTCKGCSSHSVFCVYKEPCAYFVLKEKPKFKVDDIVKLNWAINIPRYGGFPITAIFNEGTVGAIRKIHDNNILTVEFKHDPYFFVYLDVEIDDITSIYGNVK